MGRGDGKALLLHTLEMVKSSCSCLVMGRGEGEGNGPGARWVGWQISNLSDESYQFPGRMQKEGKT